MVDFHTHILYDVDDGSKNLKESINLIEEAKKAGFTDIVLTSHFLEGLYEKNVLERKEKLNKLSKNISNINLHLGNEIFLSPNIDEFIKEKKACTIGNSSFILFELPFNVMPKFLFEIISELQNKNYKLILAHPERYIYMQENYYLYEELYEKGVLFQGNYGSFIGQYGNKAEKTVKELMLDGYINFLGTDVHKENSIYKYVPDILNMLKNKVGKNRVNQIVEINPRRVLYGEY